MVRMWTSNLSWLFLLNSLAVVACWSVAWLPGRMDTFGCLLARSLPLGWCLIAFVNLGLMFQLVLFNFGSQAKRYKIGFFNSSISRRLRFESSGWSCVSVCLCLLGAGPGSPMPESEFSSVRFRAACMTAVSRAEREREDLASRSELKLNEQEKPESCPAIIAFANDDGNSFIWSVDTAPPRPETQQSGRQRRRPCLYWPNIYIAQWHNTQRPSPPDSFIVNACNRTVSAGSTKRLQEKNKYGPRTCAEGCEQSLYSPFRATKSISLGKLGTKLLISMPNTSEMFRGQWPWKGEYSNILFSVPC